MMNESPLNEKALQEDLEQLFAAAPEPSAELRARVLGQRRASPAPRWRPAAALSAAVATAAVLTLLLMRPDAPMIQGDLNGDGRVDILDAWQLSHRPDADTDLEPLMAQIVTLPGGKS